MPTYPGHFVVKKVTTGGTFRLHHQLLYIANALVDQTIGLEETDDGVWAIYSTPCCLAPSMNATTSSVADTPRLNSVTHVAGQVCYPSSRLLS